MIHIGIDLGTNNCCITFVDSKGKINVLRNIVTDEFLIPSTIHYSDSQLLLVGAAAKNQNNYISNFKRLIGHKIDDEEVINLTNKLGYKIIDKDEQIFVHTVNGDISVLHLTTLLLEHLKDIINEHIKEEWKCIITVPAYFNENQRKITWNAINAANIPCLKMISEPTSACLAYLYQKNISVQKTILVVDFGAGTFDLSIVQIDNLENLICEVLGIYGDNNLGGIDITRILSDYYNLSMDKAEEIKIKLSTNDIYDNISRHDLELLLDKYLSKKIILIIDEVIKRANLKHNMIDEIVMVGGSSKIPWIKKLIADHLKKSTIQQQSIIINNQVYYYEDIGVSLGAALHGYYLKSNDIVLIDRLPLSIGIRASQDIFVPIISRNSIIPVSLTKVFTTDSDNQTEIIIDIYQGDSKLISENILIGTFNLEGIRLAPKGEPVIFITIKVDVNGMVEIIAKERRGDAKSSITINNIKEKVNDEMIKTMLTNLPRHLERDRKMQKLMESYMTLFDMINKISYHINNNIVIHLDEEVKINTRQILINIIKDMICIENQKHLISIDTKSLETLFFENDGKEKLESNKDIPDVILIKKLTEWIKYIRKELDIFLLQIKSDKTIYMDNYELSDNSIEIENTNKIDIDSLELLELVNSLIGNLNNFPIRDEGKDKLKEYLDNLNMKQDAKKLINDINEYCELIYKKYM